MKLLPALGLFSSLALLQACVSSGSGGAQVTPQRPTLSSNTGTTAEGTFELEAGGHWDPGDTFFTPTTLKYGASKNTELFFGWVPIVYDDGTTTIGPTQVGARHRYYEGAERAMSAAVQVFVDLPTGNNRLSTGETVTSFAGIVDGSHEAWDFTGYGSFDLVGDPVDKGVDPGLGLSFVGSHPIQDAWSGYGELAGVFVPNQDYDPIFGRVGAFYSVAEWLALDVGILVGFNSDAPDFAILFGLTRNFGQVSRYAQARAN